jgi:hypothetical protein
MSGRFQLAGKIPVDSGQIMLIDPCYIKNDFPSEHNDAPDLNYAGACKVTLRAEGCGVFGNLAFATSSGYGDGLYPVYVKRTNDGRIAEVKIKFIF